LSCRLSPCCPSPSLCRPSLCCPLPSSCHPSPIAVLPLANAIPPNGSIFHQPLLQTFASRCYESLVPAVHHLPCSHRWFVVVFSAHPAAYRLNHQAENIFMFSLLDLFDLLRVNTTYSTCRNLIHKYQPE
jgi:hypothetical protein